MKWGLFPTMSLASPWEALMCIKHLYSISITQCRVWKGCVVQCCQGQGWEWQLNSAASFLGPYHVSKSSGSVVANQSFEISTLFFCRLLLFLSVARCWSSTNCNYWFGPSSSSADCLTELLFGSYCLAWHDASLKGFAWHLVGALRASN